MGAFDHLIENTNAQPKDNKKIGAFDHLIENTNAQPQDNKKIGAFDHLIENTNAQPQQEEPLDQAEQYGRVHSFLSGGLQGYASVASGINKLIGDEEGRAYWNDVQNNQKAHTQNHDNYALGGEILLDPLNLTPAGLATKGSKLARIGQSLAGGAVVGGATTALHNYGQTGESQDTKNAQTAMGAGFGAVINGVISSLTKGKVDNGSEIINKIIGKLTSQPDKINTIEEIKHELQPKNGIINDNGIGDINANSELQGRVGGTDERKATQENNTHPSWESGGVDGGIGEISNINNESVPLFVKSRGDNSNVGYVRHSLTDEARANIEASGATPLDFNEGVSADDFINALTSAKIASKNGSSVFVHPKEDYEKMRLFLSDDGLSGGALNGDEIVSVFRHPNSQAKRVTESIIPLLVENGGKRLDAYDTTLPNIYGKHGFSATGRMKWNDEYAPSDFIKSNYISTKNPTGEPDVVFMQHNTAPNYKDGDGNYFNNYNEAVAKQKEGLPPQEQQPRTMDAGQNEILPQEQMTPTVVGQYGDNPSLKHIEELTKKSLNKDWKKNDNSFFGWAKEMFTDTLSGKYHSEREDVFARKAENAKKAKDMQVSLSSLSEAEDKVLHKYIVGDSDFISDKLRPIADDARNTIASLTNELVDSGLMTREAVNEWENNYLKRNYEKYYTNPLDVVNKLTIEKQFERGKIETYSKNEYDRLVADGTIDTSLTSTALKDGGIRIKNLPNERIEVKRDWTKEERSQMGEIQKASISIPETMLSLSNLVEHANFLKNISNNVDGAVITAKSAIETGLDADTLKRERFSLVPTDKKYGALSGQWVRNDVLDDIKGLNDNIFDTFLGSDNKVGQAWKEYLRLWKKTKTVYNVGTHISNFTTNMFLMHLSGMNALDVSKAMADTYGKFANAKEFDILRRKQMNNTATQKDLVQMQKLSGDLKYYHEAEKEGLLQSSELNDILAGQQTSSVSAKGTLGVIDDKVTGLYQKEDGVGKLAMFSHLRENGWGIKEAKHAVESIMPDYNKPIAKGWKILRDTGVSPFISWSYFTAPKIFKMILTKQGAIQATKALGTIYGLSYAMSGENPLNNAPIADTTLPDDFKFSRIPIDKSGDKVTTLKVDRLNPYLQFLSPVNYAKSTFSGVTPNAFGAVLGGIKLYNGRPITSDTKPVGQRIYDRTKYGVQNFAPVPQFINSLYDFGEEKLRDKKHRNNGQELESRTSNQELLKLLGMNTMTYDKSKLKNRQNSKNDKWW